MSPQSQNPKEDKGQQDQNKGNQSGQREGQTGGPLEGQGGQHGTQPEKGGQPRK